MKKIKVVKHKIEKEILNCKTIFYVYDVYEIDDENGLKTINVYQIYDAVQIWDFENFDMLAFKERANEIVNEKAQ